MRGLNYWVDNFWLAATGRTEVAFRFGQSNGPGFVNITCSSFSNGRWYRFGWPYHAIYPDNNLSVTRQLHTSYSLVGGTPNEHPCWLEQKMPEVHGGVYPTDPPSNPLHVCWNVIPEVGGGV